MSPDAAKRQIDRDADEPGAHARVAAELFEVGEDTDVGFLDDVLGIRIITKNAARHAEQALVVAPRQLADRRLVPLLAAAKQFVVRQALASRRRRAVVAESLLAVTVRSMFGCAKGSRA